MSTPVYAVAGNKARIDEIKQLQEELQKSSQAVLSEQQKSQQLRARITEIEQKIKTLLEENSQRDKKLKELQTEVSTKKLN